MHKRSCQQQLAQEGQFGARGPGPNCTTDVGPLFINPNATIMMCFISHVQVFCLIVIILTGITSRYFHSTYPTYPFAPGPDSPPKTKYNPVPSYHYCDRKKPYECQGEKYNNFTSRLADYVMEKNHSTWGKQRVPLPDGASILVLGNSHLQQIFSALVCQYSQLITFSTDWTFSEQNSNKLVESLQKQVKDIQFSNGARLVVVTNSPLMYSKNWTNLLQKYDPLHRSLEHYTAIVLGKFNGFSNKTNKTNNFKKSMLAYEHELPDEINYSTVPPPTLYEVSQLYPRKPILAVSMFAEYALGWQRQARKTISALRQKSNRHNVLLLCGRAHIEALGIECGSDGKDTLNDCSNRGDVTPFGRSSEHMHRCTGDKGGHADLLAWDVIEALHTMT